MSVDKIILGNNIFDGTGRLPFAGGLAVAKNRIVRVGSREEILKMKDPDVQVYEFGDELIMPGFHDAHMHYFMGAMTNSSLMVDVRDAKTPEECCERLKDFTDKNPELDYAFGAGWFSHNWENDTRATKELMDSYVSDRPAILVCADFHTYWLNSKAMEACGFRRDTTFEVGELERYEDGEPTGMVLEIEAGKTVIEYILEHYSLDQKMEMQKEFQRNLLYYGITSTTDLACELTPLESLENYAAAKKIEEEGQGNVRVFFYPSLGLSEDMDDRMALYKEYNSMFVRMSGLKQFVDGVTSTWTGYMLEPYTDMPDTCGYPFVESSLLERTILRANELGARVRLHTLGDAAIRLSLDIFEKSRKVNTGFAGRNTLEHVETIDPAELKRFKETDTVCSMQPEHLILERNEKVDRIGLKRCLYEWPFKSLDEAGAVLAFGTDYPVVHYNPFVNIYAAVCRLFPEGTPASVNQHEAIGMAETLRAYTLGSAMANGVEDELGTLEEGKLADITVLDRNLFEVPCDMIKTTQVKLTMCDGRVVYRAE